MAETPVLGQSPISFNAGGSHLTIPLSTLYFEVVGSIEADHWPVCGANSVAVNTLLARQVKKGVLRPGTKPASKGSLTAAAVSTRAGVAIDIEISNVAETRALSPTAYPTPKSRKRKVAPESSWPS